MPFALIDSVPHTAAKPSAETIKALKNLFPSESATTSQGLASICYLTANILPECVWGVAGMKSDTRRGIRVEVRSGGLPIGAGLGSSAAFSVALVGALLRLRQLMFGDLLGYSKEITLEDLTGDGSAEGWCPPTAILHILNDWAFGMKS
jgi:mevalonate kinase